MNITSDLMLASYVKVRGKKQRGVQPYKLIQENLKICPIISIFKQYCVSEQAFYFQCNWTTHQSAYLLKRVMDMSVGTGCFSLKVDFTLQLSRQHEGLIAIFCSMQIFLSLV